MILTQKIQFVELGSVRENFFNLSHLQIGCVFVVKITTETTSSGFEDLAWADFNIFAVEKNQEVFLDEVDIVYIVFVPLNNQNNKIELVYKRFI